MKNLGGRRSAKLASEQATCKLTFITAGMTTFEEDNDLTKTLIQVVIFLHLPTEGRSDRLL